MMYARLLVREIERLPNFSLFWCGWKSSVYELARSGWQIYTDVNPHNLTYNLALKNTQLHVIGISNTLCMDFLRRFNNNPDSIRGMRFEDRDCFPTIEIAYMSYKVEIHIQSESFGVFRETNEVAMLPTHSVIKLEDCLPHTRLKEEETKIIVPSYTIPELMTLIKEQQAPKQKEIRERMRRDTPIETLEAKIVSIR